MKTDKPGNGQTAKFRHSRSSDTKFQTKLLLAMFKIALPVIAIICAGFFLVLVILAQNSTASAQYAEMERLRSNISNLMANTENLSRDLIFNDEVQTLMKKNHNGELYPDTAAAAYHISGFTANRDYIDCVILTGTDQTVYSTERAYTYLSDFNQIRKKYWFPEMTAGSDAFYWYTNPNEENYSNSIAAQGPPTHLMLVRSIYSLEDYTTLLGYLMIYIDDDYLNELWNSCNFGRTTNIWITDENNNILLHNRSSYDYSFLLNQIGSDTANRMFCTKEGFFFAGSSSFSDGKWNIYIATPFSEVCSNIFFLIGECVLLTLLTLLLLLFFSSRTSAAIAKPVTLLSRIMDSFHGSDEKIPLSETRIYEYRNDEIGQIYRSYSKMVKRMDMLIHEIFIKNLEKKDAELALLQSQINPHFLYNTLDSINWMALANDQDEISEMVTALSDTFRLSLTRNNSSYVQIGQEIAYVKSYLVLQKFRYEEKLSYHFSIEEGTEDLFIPKFILQPIVENALKHGIDTLEDGGNITISLFRNSCDLIIQVINDGTDIDLKQMADLLVFDPDHMEYLAFKTTGYGVQNIHRRIRIICGMPYGLTYKKESSRTVCEIRLPVKTTDEPDQKNPSDSLPD